MSFLGRKSRFAIGSLGPLVRSVAMTLVQSKQWRITCDAVGAGNYASINEFKLFIDGVEGDITRKLAFSSSSNYGGITPAVMFDGSNTVWGNTSGQFPAWAEVPFWTSKKIASYKIRVSNVYPQEGPKTWELQYWNGTAWVAAHSVTGAPSWYAAEIRAYTLDTPITAQRWRIYITASYSASYVSIAEMEMYEQNSSDRLGCVPVYSASSAYNGNYLAGNAFDGTTGYWSSSVGSIPGGAWLMVTFTEPFAPTSCKIKAPENSDYVTAPTAFKIEYFDGENWVAALTVTGEAAWTAGQEREYSW